ncbi:MAG: polysaccharide biosynthesis tyrosine autokinase [Okeania sp. SIO2G4]|uniref:GumC family protein n=1 Tax=unclassified Okeania TaxID=2634635 RepID=UPI0013BD509B|nr:MULTISPECIES: polysaccharide biosynthesis tyrosine autokinase [unclassified Okeania]NEP04553.1 polysaccharide biosynthesis tyrosine autokinase [Okeania sp. SIO4D6]NEP71772.1 polysaccharide biosynthesis tyrosine autokinase [Okeania sp. SIO2G5]NEP92456.1 polysaccharide biosynthesis tyrosine autokinase [Okeania sp. SIO2F5]NEQ90472.1 polysaccharide biosynthesis tyrosine autokinase [Okeania sp. SIO2G4]
MEPEKISQLSLYNNHGKLLDRRKNFNQNQYIYEAEFHQLEEKLSQKENKIWNLVCHRFFLIFSVATATTTGAYFWTLNQIPIYEGKFKILVEPVTITNPVNYQLGTETRNLTTNNQENWEQQAAQIIYGTGQEKITSSPNQNIQQNQELDKYGLDYQSQIQVLKSPQFMQSIIGEIQKEYPEINYNFLFKKPERQLFSQEKLKIQRLDNTKIIEVSYRDSDVKKIQFVLDKLAAAYTEYGQNDQKTNTDEGLDFIEEQISKNQQKIKELRKESQQLQQEYLFINPELKSQEIAAESNQIQSQKLENKILLDQQRSLHAILQSQLGINPEEALMASALSQAARYQSLLNKLQEVETTIALESARFKEKAPQMRALYQQREKLLPLLNQEAEKVIGRDIEEVSKKALAFQDSVRLELIHKMILAANQIEVLEVRSKVLDEAEAKLNEYISKMPEVVRRYQEIQQELKNSNNILKDLLEKQQQLQIEVVFEKVQPWELIAPPELLKTQNGELVTISPNMILNLALGGVTGLLLGILLAKFGEGFQQDVFQTPKEVKKSIGLPLLGIIPIHEQRNWMNDELKENNSSSLVLYPSAFQEAFRTLNANIRLLNIENPIHSFVISSATPGDGKSTVAGHLARAAAAMGQRVLLIDGDLRCPQIHNMMGLSNQQGLSSIIADGVPIETAIQRSPVDENLFVLTSGPIPPDPTKILSSPQMHQLIQDAATNFDLVICDTAPLLGRADASLLSACTNGLMLVVGLGKTEREALSLALDDLSMAGVPMLGIVGNGDQADSYYQRYYDYEYIQPR